MAVAPTVDDVDHSTHHLSAEVLAEAHDRIADAPADAGALEMIVRRPAVGQREVLEFAELDLLVGLVGDTWADRSSKRTPDRTPHPDMQLNVMSSRVLDALATRDRWHLAGDQLIVDLDLTPENLPAGTRIQIGAAVIEVTDQPHTGCPKFSARYGADALRFVNKDLGAQRRYRGVNAKVVEAGQIRSGDAVTVLR